MIALTFRCQNRAINWRHRDCFFAVPSDAVLDIFADFNGLTGPNSLSSVSSRSIDTKSQCCRNSSILLFARMKNTWKRNGVSSQGRSGSATYIPIRRPSTSIFLRWLDTIAQLPGNPSQYWCYVRIEIPPTFNDLQHEMVHIADLRQGARERVNRRSVFQGEKSDFECSVCD